VLATNPKLGERSALHRDRWNVLFIRTTSISMPLLRNDYADSKIGFFAQNHKREKLKKD